MSLPIDHTKKVLKEIEEIVMKSVDLSKSGKGLALILGLVGLIGDLGDLSMQAMESWPELKDLDSEESAELGRLSFESISAIIKKIAEIKHS